MRRLTDGQLFGLCLSLILLVCSGGYLWEICVSGTLIEHAPLHNAQVQGIRVKDGKAYIDVNTADETLLASLPGIGPSLAGRIVAYREENGPFRSLTDLDKVNGIGESMLNVLAEYLCFDIDGISQ